MNKELKYRLLTYLEQYVSENKRTLIASSLDNRTRHITVVLEDIYQPQNASAVVRTCDCFGIQDLHVIENTNEYILNPRVVLGASKWVDIHQYNKPESNNTVECIEKLKNKGYRILATSPDRDCPSINDVEIKDKTALLFGTELYGLQPRTIEMADELVTIPMYGFTESFNLSVSAAICLNTLVGKLHASDVKWHLTQEERQEITLEWYKKIVNRSEILVKDFLSKAN